MNHARRDRRDQLELAALSRARWNIDALPEQARPGDGWRVDDHLQRLPAELAGPPLDHGSWRIAVRLLEQYEFADPSIIRGVFDPRVPLAERTMALHGRFWWMHFWMGVRVSGVVDATRQVDGRDVRVRGYAYRTLERHLETGEIWFEIWKWLDTGEVEFRMHAVSRTSHIANPFVRLGFRVFGRGLQLKFARRARERMLELVEVELADGVRPNTSARVEPDPASVPVSPPAHH